jgi:hypothetical protein
MKNTRDIDYHEHRKLQTYRLVAGREGLVLSNTISHGKDEYYKYNQFCFFLAAEFKLDALDAAPNLFVSRILA